MITKNMKWMLVSASLLTALSACSTNNQGKARGTSLKAAVKTGEATLKVDVLTAAFQGLEGSYKSNDVSLSANISQIGLDVSAVNQSTNGAISNGRANGALKVNVLFAGATTPVLLASSTDTSTWQNGQVYDLTLGSDASIVQVLGGTPRVRVVCLPSTGNCDRLGILISELSNNSASGAITTTAENAGFIFQGTRLENAQGSVKDLNNQQVPALTASK